MEFKSSNFERINELKEDNNELNKQMQYYLKEIKRIKEEENLNIKLIQKLCPHPKDKIDRIIEYQERTKHQCRICNLIW
tara:strand:+ start:427 stop:663 length:237 start_codon:yes stop_codon:yes gene_type:complete